MSTEVVIHPLVLLSVADHYHRVARDTRKRVVGVLLGSKNRNRVDITNSFAVPFEEDLADPKVWFVDHNYLENMFRMFKKVNTFENIVGFYSSGSIYLLYITLTLINIPFTSFPLSHSLTRLFEL